MLNGILFDAMLARQLRDCRYEARGLPYFSDKNSLCFTHNRIYSWEKTMYKLIEAVSFWVSAVEVLAAQRLGGIH